MQALFSQDARTIADRLGDALVTAIVKGDIASGSKISEPDLAQAYRVSRGPLREALRRLEGLHLVSRVPHAGARVVTLGLEELVEIYHIREALEGMAARLAAANMREEERRALTQLLDLHEENIEQSQGREYFQREGDFDFHYRIIQASGNQRLIDLLCSELYHLIRMYRYRSARMTARPAVALAEHRQIAAAIAHGDGEFAEMLMRKHISTARRNIERQFRAAGE